MRQCKKCNKEGYHPDVAPLTTAGGYVTDLCVPCRNLFHEYMYPRMLVLAIIESRHEAAIAGGLIEKAAELGEQRHAEKTRLYAISKEWVASK